MSSASPVSNAQDGSPKTHLYGYYLIALGALFYFYEYILRVSPSLYGSSFYSDFSVDISLFATFSSFYFYAYTPMQLIGGVLVDRVNLKILLSAAVFLCALGTFAISLSHEYSIASVGRFLEGLGSAFAFLGALKIIATYLPSQHFSRALGVVTSLGSLSIILSLAPLIYKGPSIVWIEYNWRNLLLVSSFIGFALCFFFLLAPTPKKTDLNSDQITFPEYFSELFLLLKKPVLWITALISGLMYMPIVMLSVEWGRPYLQLSRHYSYNKALIAGGGILMGWSIGALIMGIIGDQYRHSLRFIFILLGISSFISCLLSLTFLYCPSMHFYLLCTIGFLIGIFTSSQILTFFITYYLAPSPIRGSAFGLINLFAVLGGAIFQLIVNLFLDNAWDGTYNLLSFSNSYSIQSYQLTLMFIPLAFFISGLLAILFNFIHKGAAACHPKKP